MPEPSAIAAISLIQFCFDITSPCSATLALGSRITNGVYALSEDRGFSGLVPDVCPLLDSPAFGRLHIDVLVRIVLLNDVWVAATATRQEIGASNGALRRRCDAMVHNEMSDL